MTGCTIVGCRQHSGVGRMACKANSMTDRRRHKSAFLEPKGITQIFRGFTEIFNLRFVLRFIYLMTNPATLFTEPPERCPYEPSTRIRPGFKWIDLLTDDFNMLVVRKRDGKIRDG